MQEKGLVYAIYATFNPKNKDIGLGKGYFRSFTKIVEINKEGRCFRECIAIQTPKYLLLDCSLYKEERKKI